MNPQMVKNKVFLLHDLVSNYEDEVKHQETTAVILAHSNIPVSKEEKVSESDKLKEDNHENEMNSKKEKAYEVADYLKPVLQAAEHDSQNQIDRSTHIQIYHDGYVTKPETNMVASSFEEPYVDEEHFVTRVSL